MRKVCHILCVCGSGTVSSAMVAKKLRERLALVGWDAKTTETNPGEIETLLAGTHYDLIACISPVRQEYSIPKVPAVGMLTGIGEEQVVADCLHILTKKIS